MPAGVKLWIDLPFSMALLFRDFDKRVEIRGAREGLIGFEIRNAREGLIRFHRHVDFVHYLRKCRSRPGLITALRKLLAEHQHVQVLRLSDDEVIDEVARRLLNGSLQLMEMFEPRVRVLTTPQEEAQEGEAAEEYAVAGHAAASVPAAVPEEPLLPLLEEVQIEGAEVLPEIMQTMEQIDLTMASIDLASVSLEPAPSGVPAIGTAMQQVSGSVTATLNGM